MLVGDKCKLNQASRNTDLPEDLEQGWSSTASEAIINMPFERNNIINAYDGFPADDPNPMDFLSLFFDDDMVTLLVEETNKYAQRKVDAGNLKPNSR